MSVNLVIELQQWLITCMFVFSILVTLLGLWIVFFPLQFLGIGIAMNRWISTEHYFETLDRPRYTERHIYRHHRIFGLLIMAGASYTIYQFLSGMQLDMLIPHMPVLINHYWSEWFYSALYYLLMTANLIAAIAGLVVLLRPSILKGMEMCLNRWIPTSQSLRKLDESHEIAADILPGNPRLFGLAVALAGIYMLLSAGILLLNDF